MTPEDRREFTALMVRMATVYQHKLSEEAVDGYFELLHDLTLPTVRVAIQQAALTCKRFPTVAHLREAAFARKTPGVGDKPKGSYAPDVAAQRLRYGLDVTLPVKPDRDARFGQRWGIEPQGTYADVVRQVREKLRERGEPAPAAELGDGSSLPDATPYHHVHARFGIVSTRCDACALERAGRAG